MQEMQDKLVCRCDLNLPQASEIEQLIQKRIINLIDMELLKILASYHYLNHYHVRFLLEERLHPNYHKTSYLSNLNKLKRAAFAPFRQECFAFIFLFI